MFVYTCRWFKDIAKEDIIMEKLTDFANHSHIENLGSTLMFNPDGYADDTAQMTEDMFKSESEELEDSEQSTEVKEEVKEVEQKDKPESSAQGARSGSRRVKLTWN